MTTRQQSLIDYIADVWMAGDAEGFDEKTPIGELNIIDSSGVFDLVHHIQNEFAVTVPLSEINPDNFRSVETIARLVDRLVGTA